MDKKFTFHWLDGHVTESTGPDVATAFNRAGFGGGAIAALDWYDEEDQSSTEIVYDGYFYDSAKDQCEMDCNELWLGDTYISRITEVRDATRIEKLGTMTPTETCILIIPRHLEDRYHVRNVNQCPEVVE